MQSLELLLPLIDRSINVSKDKMYNTTDYLRNGVLYLNNILRPRHKKLSTLMIYSTTKCQSRCKHCSIWQKPEEHLSLHDIQQIMASRCITKTLLWDWKAESLFSTLKPLTSWSGLCTTTLTTRYCPIASTRRRLLMLCVDTVPAICMCRWTVTKIHTKHERLQWS